MDMLTRASPFSPIALPSFVSAEMEKVHVRTYLGHTVILLGTGLFQAAGRDLLYDDFIHPSNIA